MQILIPMAAKSAFFPADHFFFPKPLIEVMGRPMIERVVDGLSDTLSGASFHFVVSKDDVISYSLDGTLRLIAGNEAKIITVTGQTRGGLCSALLATDELDLEDELIVANGDQIIDVNYADAVAHFRSQDADAGVITFDSVHPRWSYARTDEDGTVTFTAEKRVISRSAIAGFYYFRSAKTFFEAAQNVLLKMNEANGLYYVSSTLNEVILKGGKVASFDIASTDYHSFYSPDKIREFEDNMANSPQRKKASLNVVIPAAGQGSRFAKAGFPDPKPFIPVEGRMMIDLVIENMAVKGAKNHTLLRKEHVVGRDAAISSLKARGVTIHPVEELTEGTACTLLLAREAIDNEDALLVANSDQYVNFDVEDFVADCIRRDLDGSILVFRDPTTDPKWSFAKLDANGLVTEVAEKRPISDLATVGVYLFRRGDEFVASAIDMIVRNDRVNNEFYTCPVYNYMIAKGARIGVYEVPQSAMHGLGTPEDLAAYLARGA